ncbi:MAG: aminoacyl-tRNA hydrolase [Desulfobacteraceae bacterium]
MPSSRLFLVAGLGNPGEKYAQTRHNIGFLVVDDIARRFFLPLDKSLFNTACVKGVGHGSKLVLAKPLSFMNRSGFPLQKLASYFKIDLCNVIVVHDDLDLEFGKVKIAKNRGHGGHNGIRSMVEAFGSKDFIRIRAGVGRPGNAKGVIGHVLGRFSSQEKKELPGFVETAADAAVEIMDQGLSSAMNRYNQTPS